MKKKRNQHTMFAALILMTAYACATSEPVNDSGERSDYDISDIERGSIPIFELSDEMIAALDDLDIDDLSEDEQRLYFTRSRLTDTFDFESHDMPAFYLEEIEEEEVDIYQGFRVQILSTRDVNLADSTQAEFESWADSTFADYFPRGYVHYRQPYYRVRIGDFHDRDRAIELSRLVKFKYPDAWIIHDRINPYRVPADTLEIKFDDSPDEISLPEASSNL